MTIPQALTSQFSASTATDTITAALNTWQKEDKTRRLWMKDATLWTNEDESRWMGWLELGLKDADLKRIADLANAIKASGFTDIVLLGMGGSSLCPAMMADTFGKIADYPQLHILDSINPDQLHHLENSLDLKKTFFIVSSKSGSTLESNIFKDYFYARLQTVLNKKEVGDRFIAITDPGTSLEAMAKKDGFKAIFQGVPSIGGRYSALSNFGMVPAGFMGIDVPLFLSHVEAMQKACSSDTAATENPGVVLGVMLGVYAKLGKDKVTLIVSSEIHALGAWIEQLLAESTGKDGKALIPVDQEPLGKITAYRHDRVFVYIRLETAPDAAQDHAINALEASGFMVIKLNLADKMHLGATLFLWEMATAVASSILSVHPFNQPDVEESKVIALALTRQYEETGEISKPSPLISENGITLFSDEEMLQQFIDTSDVIGCLRVFLNTIQENDYVNLAAFIEMSDKHTALLQQIRTLIRDWKKVATCLGFGPRFLHSTGQAHKGGPNTGVFLQITADNNEDIPVPDHRYTFGTVIAAQAQADFNVLSKRSRRILRVHLGKDVPGGLQRLYEKIQQAIQIV